LRYSGITLMAGASPLKIMAATKPHAPFPLPPLRSIKVPSIPLPRAVLRVGAPPGGRFIASGLA